MRSLAPLAIACLLAAAAAACGDDGGATSATAAAPRSTTAPTAPPADDPLGGFVPDPLDWAGCGDGTECATLAVPLDWDDPSGTAITLAVARVRATGGDDERLGVLVTNPGGPGAPGVDFVAGDGGPFAGTEVAERFDVVSWDPRGVGGSTPLDCAAEEAVAFWALDLDLDPDDPAEQAAVEDGARAVAEACGAGAGQLLPHVGTDDVARDLEALRRALGEPLAYYGFSYGTAIGLRYAELFPSGADRIVLDGVVDPTDELTDLLRGQAAAFEEVAVEMLDGVEDTWERVAAAAEEAPIPARGGRGLTAGDLLTATTMAGYHEAYWPVLREGLELAEDGDATVLVDLADTYWALTDFAAYQAVSCLDSEHPVGAEAWADFVAEMEAVSPRFGASFANEMLACAFWPVPPEPVTGPVRAEGSPPILVIGTTGDAATPVAQARAVAEGLANGHLLVLDADGHTAFGRSACVEDAVARYLVDGEVPGPDARC